MLLKWVSKRCKAFIISLSLFQILSVTSMLYGKNIHFFSIVPVFHCLSAAFQPCLTNMFSKPIVSNNSSTDSTMNMHNNFWKSPKGVKKRKFSSNYTSESAIITTLYIICIFQLIFKSCLRFCMQIYNIFRIRYITGKSISTQLLPCFSLISCVLQ